MFNYVIFFMLLVIVMGLSGYFYKKSRETAKIVGCFWLAFMFDLIYERGEFSPKIFLFWIGFMFVVFVADVFANTGVKKEK